MKIAIMGAGAVGCYYGGMLARAGHDVTLIGRPQHVEAIMQNGLLLETQTFTEYVPLKASTAPDAVQSAQLVLCCIKSTDTESAAAAMAPFLEPDAIILSLQNGVDNAQRLQAVTQHPVHPAVVYVATGMAGPGHVKHNGRGELVIGPSPCADQLCAMFAAAAIPVEISGNVTGALWAKLIINCAFNAFSAITQLPYGRLMESEGVPESMRELVEECLAVAKADGVSLPGNSWESVLQIAQSMAKQFSSTAQDLALQKPSEIDQLNGYVVARGQALKVPTPVNRLMLTLVKLLESKYGESAVI